jgi:hypothetical protein
MGVEKCPKSSLSFGVSIDFDPKTASTDDSIPTLFACIQGSKGKSSSRSEVTDSCQNSPPPGVRNASLAQAESCSAHRISLG